MSIVIIKIFISKLTAKFSYKIKPNLCAFCPLCSCLFSAILYIVQERTIRNEVTKMKLFSDLTVGDTFTLGTHTYVKLGVNTAMNTSTKHVEYFSNQNILVKA